jgi:cytoskeletal protein CcmA (bactofilin family)
MFFSIKQEKHIMLKGSSYDGANSDEATVISKGVKIEGKLSCSGSIRLDGEVQGDISSQSTVIIGENGKVNGEINAENITIGGKVTGTVKAKEKLVLDAKANLQGDIFSKIVAIEAGANFNGNCKMGNEGSKTSFEQSKQPDTVKK